MDENVSSVVSECNKIVQNEYKKLRHDKDAALLYWQCCKTYGFKTHEKYYEHFIEKEMRVLENVKVKFLCDYSIQRGKNYHYKPASTSFAPLLFLLG